MARQPIIVYFRKNYGIILAGLLLIALSYWLDPKSVWYVVLLSILLFARHLYLYEERQRRIEKLKAKGLTEQDLVNIDFVKKWEFTRGQGIWLYCLKDGGLVGLFGLSFVFGALFVFSRPVKFLAEPGDMFHLIFICAIAGAIAGIILFRILWRFNEHRFKKLTDPLNTMSSANKTPFKHLS